jgi:hypothetical protein
MERLSKILKWSSRLFLILFFTTALSAQDKPPDKKKFNDIVDFKGYLKFMETSSFVDLNNILTSSLIHNRLNFNIYATPKWSFKVDIRNRIIWGNYLSSVPGYIEGVTADNGLWDMSINWVEGDAFVFNTTIDRLWADFSISKFSARLGRQRINWGLNYVWNPNDLFNAFNYFDFDYEERPGADALRLQYFTGGMSAIDVGLKPATEFQKAVYAGQYRFNVVGYDFQVLGGYYHERITAGAGLAGNLGTAALKAEGTWFGENDTIADSFSGALDIQYGFKSGINLIFSYLYNSAGSNTLDLNDQGIFVFSELSADNLMPSKHSLFGDISYTFNPLITADLGAIYTFGFDMFFIMPNFTYSITENLDLNVLAQVFVALKTVQGTPGSSNFLYIRFKWSF